MEPGSHHSPLLTPPQKDCTLNQDSYCFSGPGPSGISMKSTGAPVGLTLPGTLMLETQPPGNTRKGAVGSDSVPLIKAAVNDQIRLEPVDFLLGESSAARLSGGGSTGLTCLSDMQFFYEIEWASRLNVEVSH